MPSESITIAVDLAKNVFELAITNEQGRIIERRRLTRAQFERFWSVRAPCRVVMEACSGAHFWARRLLGMGFDVVLLPPRYVRPYVRRNETDRTDCEALLEALRCAGIRPVAVKSEDQQALAALHRVRTQWVGTRTARINAIRALLREFGIVLPQGASRVLLLLPQLLEQARDRLPARLRSSVLALWQEIQDLEARIRGVEAELEQACRAEPQIQALRQIPGIGLLTATALFAAVGDVHAFPSGRHLASWLGITPRERSSGSRRCMGRISKQGDPYLRMLLTHGARSALLLAQRKERAGQPLSYLEQWALEKAKQAHPNRAVLALANKMARTAWAVWHHERHFDGDHALKIAA